MPLPRRRPARPLPQGPAQSLGVAHSDERPKLGGAQEPPARPPLRFHRLPAAPSAPEPRAAAAAPKPARPPSNLDAHQKATRANRTLPNGKLRHNLGTPGWQRQLLRAGAVSGHLPSCCAALSWTAAGGAPRTVRPSLSSKFHRLLPGGMDLALRPVELPPASASQESVRRGGRLGAGTAAA
uniref:Uncharacterized protein n=1 Tax=Sphaerodactylus townsendi TaxID=933632 RepID=A0ACB8F3K3_9SAUR